MVSSISSNISSIQLLRAQNAFNQAKISPKAEDTTEEISLNNPAETDENKSLPKTGTTVERLQNEIIDNIRDDLTEINGDITDEDIRYGLTFGRSVLVDCSA